VNYLNGPIMYRCGREHIFFVVRAVVISVAACQFYLVQSQQKKNTHSKMIWEALAR
jgi:hypothetical protein